MREEPRYAGISIAEQHERRIAAVMRDEDLKHHGMA